MPFRFCPQCGTKLQPDFKFCPSCGERLPCPDEELAPVRMAPPLGFSPPGKDGPSVSKTSLALSTSHVRVEEKSNSFTGQTCTPSSQVTAHSPLQRTRNSLRLEKLNIPAVAPPRLPPSVSAKDQQIEVAEPTPQLPSSPVKKTPRAARGKAKLDDAGELSGANIKGDEPAVDVSPLRSSATSVHKSPFKGKNKAKRAKYAPAVTPLQEGEELTDTTGRKWTLGTQLSQSTAELIYEVSGSSSKESNHILKLGAKDGRIFSEQNFLQRAAKPASVEKWMKQNKMDFLGIPSCVGFGLHADSYRFLIFPDMGRSLRSVMDEGKRLLSETTVLQLACRVLDVLRYVHANEYVHADVNTENVYIQQGAESQVFLVGYCHAFRFCPGGKHVEYREDSRAPHEGATEFISLDTHKGAAPSRRSDLQSLAYCMLRWHAGTLPWSGLALPDEVAEEKERYTEDVPALLSHCFGKRRVSGAFKTYVSAAMALQYSELPDYSALRDGLSDALLQLGGSVEQPLRC